MKKISKFGIGSLIALVMGGAVKPESASAQNQTVPGKTVKKEATKGTRRFSVRQIETAIETCDSVLRQLEETIDSKESTTEERYEARRAHADIVKERAEWVKRMEEAKAEQAKTIDIRDAAKTR